MKKLQIYEVKLHRQRAKLFDGMELRLTSTMKAASALKKIFNIEEWHNERFGFIAMDSGNEAIGIHIISEGTINETAIYLREIATRALLNNARSVILFHNHPGSTLTPSNADLVATNKVKKGLELFGITLLDHIILTHNNHLSFGDKGYL